MLKSISILIAIAAMFILVSGIAIAAPSFLSTSGNILTPDDTVLETGDFTANYHSLDLANTVKVYGANIGVAQNLEVGIARLDSDAAGASADTLINAKYKLLEETVTLPSVAVGVVDMSGQLDPDSDAGFYLVVGKNITPMATGITGEPVAPLRGFVGIGTGIYNGLFAGVDWTINPRAKVIAEYINELNINNAISEKSVFNVGARLAITESLTLDAAMIDGDDFAFGISYLKIGL